MAEFGPPDKITAWTLTAMAELRESICRDLVNKKVFAFHTRVRQPEELYIRTLYALFVASREEYLTSYPAQLQMGLRISIAKSIV